MRGSRVTAAVVGMLLLTPAALLGLSLAAAGPAGAQTSTPSCDAPAVSLSDGSFETPGYHDTDVHFVAPGALGTWQTTDTAFELWSNGAVGVTSADGDQHLELNAHTAGTVYQAVATTPGTTIEWSFEHRARLVTGLPGSAVDTMRLLIGPDLAGAVSHGDFSDTDVAWAPHAGSYLVPAGQTTTVFAFQAVSTSTGDPSTGNFLDNVRLDSPPCLDVATTITDDGGGVVHPGDVLTIQVSATNVGSSTASAVVLASAIPAQTAYLPGSLRIESSAQTDAADADAAQLVAGSPVWQVGAGATSLSGGQLAVGQTVTVSYQVVVAATATGTITADSTADGSWHDVGPLRQERSAPAQVPVVPSIADVSVTIAPDAPTAAGVVAGGPIGFSVTSGNIGPDAATAATVAITVDPAVADPVGVPDPSYPAASCSSAGQVVTCAYPNVPAGDSAITAVTGVVLARTPAGTTIGARVSITSTSTDPVLANNSSATVTSPSTVAADLAMSITASSGIVSGRTPTGPGGAVVLSAGAPVAYLAMLTNLGPSDARTATAALKLDPALRNWSVSTSTPGSCIAFGTTVICSFGDVPVGASIQLSVNGSVSPSAVGGAYVLTSQARALSPVTPDPNPGNDAAISAVPLSIAVAADLGTSATLTTAQVVAGGGVDYAVTTTNVGPSDATSVVVTMVAPSGVLNPIGVPDPTVVGGTCSTLGQTITCTYPTVRAGVTATTSVRGTVDPLLPIGASFGLSASSRSATPDPNSANDAPVTATTPQGGIRAAAQASALANTGAAALDDLHVGLLALLVGCALSLAGHRGRSARPSRRR